MKRVQVKEVWQHRFRPYIGPPNPDSQEITMIPVLGCSIFTSAEVINKGVYVRIVSMMAHAELH